MLSVVLVVWNEAKNLPRAVSSVKKIADEIIVVDTESTDDSYEVARKLGCKVFKHKNTGIVEPVRNFSIQKAKGDWILILDADEEVSQTLSDKISAALKSPQADYYRIPRKSLIFGKWIKSSHWWPDYVYRLFKKGHITWEDTIHSIPFTRGVGEDFTAEEDLAIIHHHYSSISQYVDRLNRYTDHQYTALQSAGYSFDWKDLIRKPGAEFINQYFARNGFKEGLHGLALSLLQAFSELVLYLKLWEKSDFVQTSVDVEEVKDLMESQSKEFIWWKYESGIRNSGVVGKIVGKVKRKIGM